MLAVNQTAREKVVSMFRVPILKDKETAKLWLSRAKRHDLSFSDLISCPRKFWVCQNHFSKSQLENRKHGAGVRVYVKPGEIPFPNGSVPTTTTRSSKAISTFRS